MPRKIELERERDDLRARIEEARSILDEALGFQDDEHDDDEEEEEELSE